MQLCLRVEPNREMGAHQESEKNRPFSKRQKILPSENELAGLRTKQSHTIFILTSTNQHHRGKAQKPTVTLRTRDRRQSNTARDETK